MILANYFMNVKFASPLFVLSFHLSALVCSIYFNIIKVVLSSCCMKIVIVVFLNLYID